MPIELRDVRFGCFPRPRKVRVPEGFCLGGIGCVGCNLKGSTGVLRLTVEGQSQKLTCFPLTHHMSDFDKMGPVENRPAFLCVYNASTPTGVPGFVPLLSTEMIWWMERWF